MLVASLPFNSKNNNKSDGNLSFNFFLLFAETTRSREKFEQSNEHLLVCWLVSEFRDFNCKAIWRVRLILWWWRREQTVGDCKTGIEIFLISSEEANAFDFGRNWKCNLIQFIFLLFSGLVQYTNRLFFYFMLAGRRGLEIRLHGFRSLLPVGLHAIVCGRHSRHHLRVAFTVRHSRARRSAAQRNSIKKK